MTFETYVKNIFRNTSTGCVYKMPPSFSCRDLERLSRAELSQFFARRQFTNRLTSLTVLRPCCL